MQTDAYAAPPGRDSRTGRRGRSVTPKTMHGNAQGAPADAEFRTGQHVSLKDLIAAGMDRAQALSGRGAGEPLARHGGAQPAGGGALLAGTDAFRAHTRDPLPRTPAPLRAHLPQTRPGTWSGAGLDPHGGGDPCQQSARADAGAALRLPIGELFHWSVTQLTEFWRHLAERLRIRFAHPYHAVRRSLRPAGAALVPRRPAEHRRELLQRAGRRGGNRASGRGRAASDLQLRRVARTGQPRRQRTARRRLPFRRRHPRWTCR